MDIGKLLGLDKLENALGKLAKRPLTIFAGQCLKERDKNVSCDICQELCPARAVDLKTGVEIDYDRCVDCGICVNICPAGVFEPRLTDDFYLSRVQQALQSGEVLGFSCSKQIAAGGKDRTLAEVEVACMGRINETILIGAVALGARKIWLNAAVCAECDYRDGMTLAGQTAQGVDKFLEAWGRPVEFLLTSTPPDIEHFSQAAEVLNEEYNRRELMVKFRREALAAGLGLAKGRVEKIAAVVVAPTEESFTYHLPRKRELLLELTKKLGEPAQESLINEDLSFYGLAIEPDRCNLCSNCVLFCPTRALSVEREGDNARLTFNISRCLGCDLCVQVCSPKALSTDSKISLSDIAGQGSRPLLELSYHKCEKCWQMFASASPKKVCDFCRLRAEKTHDDSWS